MRNHLIRDRWDSFSFAQMIMIPISLVLPGTLGNIRGYGVGNPREIFSRSPEKLLKFSLLKFR
jgi:hypothetical protein